MKHCGTKIVENDEAYSTISSFRDHPLKLRAKRGQKYFLNISKTRNNLWSIIEAKLLVSTFYINWYQWNENWWRNKGFQGAENLKLWCFLSLKRKTFCETLYTPQKKLRVIKLNSHLFFDTKVKFVRMMCIWMPFILLLSAAASVWLPIDRNPVHLECLQYDTPQIWETSYGGQGKTIWCKRL